ncbi:DUF4303 domain-containing protein [Nocardiopsis sp. NPDC006139]|uniref:DUF4303 domain-containing protein n=1 Tax=Nocardiopsis sp. NPDC006139 TaxID=3154578 RepID=UPI0033B6747F
MTDPNAVSAYVLLRERPPAAVLAALHRVLGLGVSEVARRALSGEPLLRVELFGDDHAEAARRLRTVLDLVAPHRHEVHECVGGASPGPENRTDAAALLAALAAAPEPPAPVRPAPDPELTRVIAEATRAAVADLRARHPEHFHAFALLTTGEALPPYLAAGSAEGAARTGAHPWSLPDGPYAVWGYEEHFGEVVRAFGARGDLFDLPGERDRLAEYATRLASMEEALRRLDAEGFFGRGADRLGVLLLAGTMPPDEEDAGAVRRLNPAGPLRDSWLREESDDPGLPVDEGARAELAGHRGGLAPAPNPSVADLWRTTPGLHLADGTAVYGPHTLAERNAAFEVARHAPGWVLVGDDGGGRGLLMREAGPDFDPATGRESAEVVLLDLGALCPGVADEGEFLTDDLVGWLSHREPAARDGRAGGAPGRGEGPVQGPA